VLLSVLVFWRAECQPRFAGYPVMNASCNYLWCQCSPSDHQHAFDHLDPRLTTQTVWNGWPPVASPMRVPAEPSSANYRTTFDQGVYYNADSKSYSDNLDRTAACQSLAPMRRVPTSTKQEQKLVDSNAVARSRVGMHFSVNLLNG